MQSGRARELESCGRSHQAAAGAAAPAVPPRAPLSLLSPPRNRSLVTPPLASPAELTLQLHGGCPSVTLDEPSRRRGHCAICPLSLVGRVAAGCAAGGARAALCRGIDPMTQRLLPVARRDLILAPGAPQLAHLSPRQPSPRRAL